MGTKAEKAEQEAAAEKLREMLNPGDTVYTTVHHVSASGMSRWISAYVVSADDGISDISWQVAHAIGRKVNTRNHDGVEASGAGMDMGFELVYTLSRTLFPQGFDCIGERCPGNDHINFRDEVVPSHHNDGGYALKQRWL